MTPCMEDTRQKPKDEQWGRVVQQCRTIICLVCTLEYECAIVLTSRTSSQLSSLCILTYIHTFQLYLKHASFVCFSIAGR